MKQEADLRLEENDEDVQNDDRLVVDLRERPKSHLAGRRTSARLPSTASDLRLSRFVVDWAPPDH